MFEGQWDLKNWRKLSNFTSNDAVPDRHHQASFTVASVPSRGSNTNRHSLVTFVTIFFTQLPHFYAERTTRLYLLQSLHIAEHRSFGSSAWTCVIILVQHGPVSAVSWNIRKRGWFKLHFTTRYVRQMKFQGITGWCNTLFGTLGSRCSSSRPWHNAVELTAISIRPFDKLFS